MRRIPAAVLVLLLAAAGGGCGLPDNSDVLVVGPGPTCCTSIDGGSPPPQVSRTSTTEPAQFVDFYLKAAAGDPETAVNRVKEFMSGEFANGFKPDPDVKVIRLVEKPLYTPGNPEITLRAQQVGRLKGNGVLEPSEKPGAPAEELKLRVTEVVGKGLFITGAPSTMLLTDTGLDDYYQRRTIYFWNTEQTALVPDLRYMPRSVPTVQQPTTILGWLAGGPAKWLSDRVRSLPSGTLAPENVPAIADETLQVTLNANAVPPGDTKAQDMLRRQLQWSLRPLLPRVLEVKIGHQDAVRYTGNDYLSSNYAYRLADTPERFVILSGVVRRLADAPHASDPVPVLKPAENRGIAAAAMSASATHTFAAVVTAGANGRGQRLRVAVAPAGEPAGLTDVPGLSGTLGRPVWAVTADGDPKAAVGLITVNGRLYSFGADGAKARPVEWQGEPGAVSAVSVAPDERRVALVSGGRLYRSVLGVSGDAIRLSTPEQLQAPTLSTVAAVAWSSEDFLVVAGVRGDGRVSIVDLSIDGALQASRLPDIGDKTVSYLTAYPANPSSGREKSSVVSYTAAGSAWDALSAPFPILPGTLAGVTGNPPGNASPTAPFFLD
jgi:Lipoprotein LpqB beta-propeller domain